MDFFVITGLYYLTRPILREKPVCKCWHPEISYLENHVFQILLFLYHLCDAISHDAKGVKLQFFLYFVKMYVHN